MRGVIVYFLKKILLFPQLSTLFPTAPKLRWYEFLGQSKFGILQVHLKWGTLARMKEGLVREWEATAHDSGMNKVDPKIWRLRSLDSSRYIGGPSVTEVRFRALRIIFVLPKRRSPCNTRGLNKENRLYSLLALCPSYIGLFFFTRSQIPSHVK